MNARSTKKLRIVALAVAIAAGFVVPAVARGGILSRATATLTGSSATAISVGPVAISESQAGPSGPSWNALKVGDTVILGRRSTANTYNSDWTGTLAAVGGVIDTVNRATCRPLPTGEFAFACVGVLDNVVFGGSPASNHASGQVVRISTSPDDQTFAVIAIGASNAYYNADNVAPQRCTNSSASLVGIGYAANGEAMTTHYVDPSISNAPCTFAP